EELGEPEELVRAERAKIDAAWVKRRTASSKAGSEAAAAVTAPLQYRRLNSRRRPAATEPQPALPPGQAAGPGSPEGPPGPEPAPRPTARRRLPSLPPGPPPSPADIGRLARAHLFETMVIVLIGLGGLLFPV